MANRTKSDPTPQHETMPGPGPAKLGDDAGSGVHPVEQMVDAAIDRLAREHQASRENQQRHGLVLRNHNTHGSGRLRWKGLDVSDEFRRYAERVAQGEDLPPYEGRILAEPNPKFPWEPSERKRASRKAVHLRMLLWSSAAMIVGFLSWSLATRLGNTAAPFPTTAATPPTPSSNPPVGGVETTSEAVLSIRGTPGGAAPAPEDVAAPPNAPDTSAGNGTLAALPEPTGAPPPAEAAETPSARRSAPVAPRASRRELEPVPYPDVPPPGAIREALGALLAARAEPGEFSATPGAPAGTPAPAPAESRPAPAAPASNSAPPVVRKETERESSASESLLVEKPSF